MALSTEIILTLQMLSGIGKKTILKIGEQCSESITDVDQLCKFWDKLKGKKFEGITYSDINNANKDAKEIIRNCSFDNIGIISFYQSAFPDILRKCNDEKGKYDPPIILYFRGNIDILQKPGIAVIGTREPTKNGEKAGVYFGREFAKRGYNIVSGLAIGCDCAGHIGALEVGGATTAFLANGLNWSSIYPRENLNLAKDIVNNGGLLLSEYPIGDNCDRYKLVSRDRLQAGLSYATIVVQTGISGGTMHAVNATLKAKKPLFVVSYTSDTDLCDDKTKGNIMLLENGAYSLQSKGIDSTERIIQEFIKSYSNNDPTLF